MGKPQGEGLKMWGRAWFWILISQNEQKLRWRVV